MNIKTLKDIPSLEGVKVFLRADFNVPVKGGKVVEDFRIRAAMPTIEYLRSRGAKIILASHLEVVEGEKATLEPVAAVLAKLGLLVKFVKDYKQVMPIMDGAGKDSIKNGECILLENLRMHEGEKANDPQFAKELASLADIYVNDAFPVCHREHASIVGVPKYIDGYVGLQVEKEVAHLSKAFSPAHPFLFVLGGAKFDTKLPLVQKFIGIADNIFIGGALANDFYKAKGWEVGASLVSKTKLDLSSFLNNPKLLLPLDIVTQKGETKRGDAVSKDDKIMDDGPESLRLLADKVKSARFILWNGTLGLYEDGYKGPTLELAKLIADATSGGATTIVGGGDTLAAISELNIGDRFTFISTAGGAMLDFLAMGTLPGLEALK